MGDVKTNLSACSLKERDKGESCSSITVYVRLVPIIGLVAFLDWGGLGVHSDLVKHWGWSLIYFFAVMGPKALF